MTQTSHSTSECQSDRKARKKRQILKWFRGIVAVLVIAALAWTIQKAWGQLQEQPISFSEIHWGRLVLAVVAYLGTMTLSWNFWHRVLISLKQSPRISRSLKAFFVSQLGKYVPGKALVVVLRTDLIQGENVSVAPAAASVFVETLTWIFVGSMIASLLMLLRFQDNLLLQVAAVIMMLIAGLVTWPPIFNRLASTVKPMEGSAQTYSVDFRTMGNGWLLLILGWCLNGLSLWLVVASLPSVTVTIGEFPLMLACVTLATVGGFVSLLPGGIGVRELVMIPLLGNQFGAVVAVVAAILVRFVWLTAELLAAGIMSWVGRRN